MLHYNKAPLTEGFKSALLLRLCPILPIPISGNWYVCGRGLHSSTFQWDAVVGDTLPRVSGGTRLSPWPLCGAMRWVAL